MSELVSETLVDDIVDLVEAALRRVTGIQRVDVEPNGDPDLFPALALFDGGWATIEQGHLESRRVLKLSIEGYVEAGEGNAARRARNELHGRAVAEIYADPELGQLVEDISDTELRKLTAVLSDHRRLSFSQDFEIQFTTSRTNPATPA